MADAGVSAGRILSVLKVCRLILIRCRLDVLRSLNVMQVVPVWLGGDRMAITAHRLHGNRNSQRVATE